VIDKDGGPLAMQRNPRTTERRRCDRKRAAFRQLEGRITIPITHASVLSTVISFPAVVRRLPDFARVEDNVLETARTRADKCRMSW
jgi:hypothetical protein